MRKLIIGLLAAALCVVFWCGEIEESAPRPSPKIEQTDSPFIAQVKLDSNISIRLLVLKHCPDSIANTDSNQAVQAADFAASKGLQIEDIGNYHVNREGKTDRLVWGKKYDLEGLKQFVSEQMKVAAKPGDTLVIYTIGHGSGDGLVTRLGQRSGIMKILAEAAEENDQRTFWWQLSCHAGAKLPEISTLTEAQQELFAMTCSSPGNELSYFCTQGALMKKVFTAIADKDPAIDPDGDETITAGELKEFMIQAFGRKRGELLFAARPDLVIFGVGLWANRIPIVDHEDIQGEYPKDYVPVPRRR